jgi:NTE family protein
VVVEGLDAAEASRITDELTARHAGRPLDRALLEDSILRVAGSDRYELIAYQLRAADIGPELVVRIVPKSYGPPFLLPAIDLQNIDSTAFALSLRLRMAMYDTLVPNSEIRFDIGVGTDQTLALELYKRAGRTRFFVAPRAYFTRRSLNGYEDGEFLAEYRVKRTGAGLDVGYTTSMRSEVRLGYDKADVRARLRIGVPSLPEANGTDSFTSLRWVFDGQNSPIIPSRGVYIRSAFRYFFDTPAIVNAQGTVIDDASDVPQADVTASWFKRVGTRRRMFLRGGGGSSFGHDPGFNQFYLGGPLRLGSFNNGELRGDNYVFGVGGLLHEWFRLPDVLGGNTYIGGWLEQGTAFDRWKEAEYHASLSTGLVAETLFGPLFLGYSQSLTESGGRFYLALGPFLR